MLKLVVQDDTRGLEVARPSASSVVKGYVYFATDANQYAVSDGSTWINPDFYNAMALLAGSNLFSSTLLGNAITLQEAAAPTGIVQNDILYADGTAHRLKMINNGGTATSIAGLSDKLSAFAATSSSELAGVISDETGTGVLVFGTSPTFTTSIITPLVIGGSAVGSTLTFKSTSGIGTTDAIIFLVGNNGATEGMRIIDSGFVGIGGSPSMIFHVTDTASNIAATKQSIRLNATHTLTANNALGWAGLSATLTLDQSTFNATLATGSSIGTDTVVACSGTSGTVTLLVGQQATVSNNGAGTLTLGIAFNAVAAGNSGGGTYTTWEAFKANATTAATTVYGFRGLVTSNANRWNLFLDGTAQSHIAGNLGVGASTTAPNYNIEINGTLGFFDSSGTTYDATLVRTLASPYRILTIWSKGGAAGWRGTLNLDVNYNAQAAFTALTIRANTDNTTANVGIGTTTPTSALALSGQAVQVFQMERNSTSNTAGLSLSVISGGATSAATDKAAGALILATGIGTGSSVPGLIRLQGNVARATSATSDNAIIDRAILNGFKVLTDASAISLVSCTLASGSAIGGVIAYTIEVTDGTDFQSETGYVFYSAVNKGGIVTRTITEAADSQQALSAGTLATTWAISAASPAVVSINADSSLTPSSGYPRITYAIFNHGQQAIALQ